MKINEHLHILQERMNTIADIEFFVVVTGIDGYRHLNKKKCFRTWRQACQYGMEHLTTKEYFHIEKHLNGHWVWDSSTVYGGSLILPRKDAYRKGGLL